MNDPQREGHMASHIGRRKFLATLGQRDEWEKCQRGSGVAEMKRGGQGHDHHGFALKSLAL